MGAGKKLGLAGVAALGVAAGVALGRGKKTMAAAAQAMHGDWAGELKAQHKAIQKLLKSMIDTDFADGAKRAALVEKVADAATRLGVQKENILYPALRHSDPDRVETLIGRNTEIRNALRELKSLAPEDVLWEKKARALRRLVNKAQREEEREVYPPFLASQDHAENERLTDLLKSEGLKLV